MKFIVGDLYKYTSISGEFIIRYVGHEYNKVQVLRKFATVKSTNPIFPKGWISRLDNSRFKNLKHLSTKEAVLEML